MNSVLSRPLVKQFQQEPFSNFQESINSSSSSLNNSRHSNKSDTDYWINYYTKQKNKEKEESQQGKQIKYVNSAKKLPAGSPNGKRQLIFSRPFKSKISNMKKKHQTGGSQKDFESPIRESVNQKNDEQFNEIKQELIQQTEDTTENNTNLIAIPASEGMLSPPLSSNYLQSMQYKQSQEDQVRQRQILQQQMMNQQQYLMSLSQKQISLTSSQISPIQSVTSLMNKSQQPQLKLRTSESLNIGSQGNIPTNSNNNNQNNNNNSSFQQIQQFNMLHSFKSVGDINTRKSSLFRDDSSSNLNSTLKNQPDLQCIHVNRLQGVGERQQFELSKNIFSNNQLLLINQSNKQTIGQNPQQQQQLQKTISPKSNQQNICQTTFNNQTGQVTHRQLDKSIMNFQQQKLISSMKYNSFLQGINGLNQGSNKCSVHLANDLTKQSIDCLQTKLRTDSVISNSRGCTTPQLKNDQSEPMLTSQNNYQDSFLELSKDPAHKLFLLEGYSQQNLLLKQSLQPTNQTDISQQQIQQQQPNKAKSISQATFFHELNKQRILSGSTHNLIQTPNNNTNHQANINTTIISKHTNGHNINNFGKKRLASATQYNRKLFSNYMQQETAAPSRIEMVPTQQDEPNTTAIPKNNNNTNNKKNIIQRFKSSTKMPGFNVLEGINQLNMNKQLSGSQSTTASSSSNVTKPFKIQLSSSTPKTQKSFQVLYKICNKNILNAGLKESKPTFYQINMN